MSNTSHSVTIGRHCHVRKSGRGVAVANANPNVLNIADEICPSNNDDGVAQWIEDNLL